MPHDARQSKTTLSDRRESNTTSIPTVDCRITPGSQRMRHQVAHRSTIATATRIKGKDALAGDLLQTRQRPGSIRLAPHTPPPPSGA